MLSKRTNNAVLKQNIDHYREELVKLKVEFESQTNDTEYSNKELGQLSTSFIDLHQKTVALSNEISNLITTLSLNHRFIYVPLIEVSIQYAAFELLLKENTLRVCPDAIGPLAQNELDIEFFKITDYFDLQKTIDIEIQKDIYYLYKIFRYLRSHEPTPQVSPSSSLTVANKKQNLESMLTKFILSRKFDPKKFLDSLVSHSSHGFIKLLAIRSLIFEYALANSTLLQNTILEQVPNLEESFKLVECTPLTTDPVTVREYGELFDSTQAHFIYYQVKLLAIQSGYRKRNNLKMISIETQLSENNFEVLRLVPQFDRDTSFEEIEHFVKKEEEIRQYFTKALTMMESIDFKRMPADHHLHSKMHDILLNCLWNAMSYSLMASILINIIPAEKLYMSAIYNNLMLFSKEMRDSHSRWREIDKRYHQDYVKRILKDNLSDNLIEEAHQKRYEDSGIFLIATESDLNLIDQQQEARKAVSDDIDKEIDKLIKFQRDKVENLKKKADKLYSEFSKSTAKRKDLLRKINGAAPNIHVATPTIVEVDEEDCLDLIPLNESHTERNTAVQHLEKLEARLDSFGRGLGSRVKRVYQILLDRVQAKKALHDKGMEELDESIKMAIDDLNQLLNLRSDYLREITQAGDLKEFNHAANISIADIDSLISSNQSLLTASMDLMQDIVNRSLERLKENIQQKVVKMGWAGFIQAYKGPSKLTLERRYMEGMIDVYKPKISLVNKEITASGLNLAVATVELQDPARRGFVAIEDVPGKSFLVGGASIKTLKGKPIKQSDDLDFACSCSNPSRIMDAQQFFNPKEKRRLFQLRKDGLRIDLYAADPDVHYATEDDWIRADAFTRNYTINAIYIDYLGKVYDPTNRGLNDLKKNVLSAINDPVDMLNNDASCIFAGFKKMVEGFKPDSALEKALHQWQMNPKVDKQHLYAYVKKHLLSLSHEDAVKYADCIFKYNMHEKIFGLKSVESSERILARIKSLVGIETASSSEYAFFAEKAVNSPPAPDLALPFQPH